MNTLRMILPYVILMVLFSCDTSNEIFDPHTFVTELRSSGFINNHQGVVIKPNHRGIDNVYVRLKDGESAYVINFSQSNFNRLKIFESISLKDEKLFLNNAYNILLNMHEHNILSIVSGFPENSFRIYTSFVDYKKTSETDVYKYVILFCEEIEKLDVKLIYDLNEDLIKIDENYYLYSSNFYGNYDELH